MDTKVLLANVRILHSRLAELDPPKSVNHAFVAWIHELERKVKAGILSEDISVNDHADVQLIDVRGPKQ